VGRYDKEGTGKQSVAIDRNGIASDKTRRKMLMQEAFDLVTRASALRQLDLVNGGSSTGERGYRMRLSDGDGT
jgi:hypothetical protein